MVIATNKIFFSTESSIVHAKRVQQLYNTLQSSRNCYHENWSENDRSRRHGDRGGMTPPCLKPFGNLYLSTKHHLNSKSLHCTDVANLLYLA